jgi:hypothetical protein
VVRGLYGSEREFDERANWRGFQYPGLPALIYGSRLEMAAINGANGRTAGRCRMLWTASTMSRKATR